MDLNQTEPWPYSFKDYAGRLLWICVQATLWRLLWKRIIFLRPLVLRLFGGDVSLRCQIDGGVRIHFPWGLKVGDHSAIGPGVRIYNLGGVSIGSNVVISQDVYLCGGTHDFRDPRMPLLRKPIRVEDRVWLCAGAFVGPGVVVGEGAVVGARAVVVKNVAPWKVMGGNPARALGDREIRG